MSPQTVPVSEAAVAREEFREAMSRLAAAVSIVATEGPGGRHGITASAVCSVSDDPATILVCINRSSRINSMLKQNGVMSINVLTSEHEGMSLDFAGRKSGSQDRFDDQKWKQLVTGAPILRGACTALDCRIVEVEEIGTHSIFFGRLLALEVAGSAAPLLYFDRKFRALAR